jgi:hypothetical protein
MARILEEFFEATGYDEAGWSETVPGSCVVDEDEASSAAGSPALWGSQCLEVTLDGGGSACYTLNAFGDGAVRYTAADIKISSLSFDTNEQQASLAFLYNAAGDQPCALIQLFRNGSTNEIRWFIYHTGSANLIYSETLVIDKLYRWEVKWDETADTWELWVNNVSRGSGTLTGAAATTQVGIIGFGDLLASVRAYTARYDRVEVDNAERIGDGIRFVGGATASKVGATSGDTTIALNSGLTGGIASAVSPGDLVIAAFGTGSTADRTLAITSGYTLIGSEQYANDTFDTNLRCAYKFMGATPDTTTTFGPTGSTSDAGAMAVYVFRGVDPTTPLDVAAVQATALNTSRVVPPDITPSTVGAFPVVIGAAAHNGGTDTFTSSDLTDFRTVGGNDTNDVTLGIGHQDNWSSGATNFATWGHSQADSTSFCWAATTIALRPAIVASTATVIDLTTATLNIDGQSAQNRLLSTLTSALLNFDTATVQNALHIALTSALLNFTPQAVTIFAAKLIDLTVASLTFAANTVQNALRVALISALFNFSAAAVQNALRVVLTSALLNFTPQTVTLFVAKVIDLTAAGLTFTVNAIQTALVVPLTTASLRFVTLVVEVTTGVVTALDDAYTRWRRLPRR